MTMEPEELVRRAQVMLASQPPIDADDCQELADATRSLCEQLRACMAARPDARPLLGPMLPRLVAASQHLTTARLEWVHIGGGRIAVGHRPKLSRLGALRRAGTTHLMTLLSETEGARAIGAAAVEAGLQWVWLPMVSGDPPGAERLPEVLAVFAEVAGALRAGGGVYVHCSAGIHRTGMVTHGLLRSLGCSREEAAAGLASMRTLTAAGVGELRLAWGDQFASLNP